MTERPHTSKRRRLTYGILGAISILGTAQIFYYFGWSGRISAAINRSPLDINVESTLNSAETDRGCILLDRPFNSAVQPDFARMSLAQWTECHPVSTTSEWAVHHCTVPGSIPVQEEGEPTTGTPSCYPGGYFRIQRLQPPIGMDTLEAGSCRLKAGTTLAKDAATNQYATSFLGPDTFRIVLVGPERLSLMQQQLLSDCTYAIPYLISRPGRFWVQKILHTYEGYDGFNEMTPQQGSSKYLGADILNTETPSMYYHFDVCAHCVPWVSMDETQGLAGTQEICFRTPGQQSRQYGIYRARLPIRSVQQAVGHPYEWIPARPRCRFHPDQTSFEQVEDTDSEKIKADKAEAAQCLQKARSIYFVGDSHVRMLFSGVMQRLQGRSGGIDAIIPGRERHILKAGNVEARSAYDAFFNETLAAIKYTLEGVKNDAATDITALEDVDTIVIGSRAFSAHWTTAQFVEQVKAVLDGLVAVHKTRSKQLTSQNDSLNKRNSLRIIWMNAPAWTDNSQGTDTKATWRTNHRILYWNKLVDGMIDTLNTGIGGRGVVDRLSGFEITIPFKNSTQDFVHYTSETTVDSFSAELIHKLDLCS
ncbi:MAG: hypothetical protein J3Q66DRAFT_102435 [Benniella sp.]|nr:MAG: hypothetical protein J3Q66DRAFT_102435 [Benniella sp.]